MKIATLVQTAFQQNTRIVSCDETGSAMCIDPGEPNEATAAYVRETGLELTTIVATHGHLDHIGGIAYMYEQFPNAEIVVHKDEEPLYFALKQQPLLMGIQQDQLAAMGMDYVDPPMPTRNPTDGEVLQVGELKFEVRHCPGHTLGHICLVEHDQKATFTGDCLFSRTIGRTDLPGGNHSQLIRSIQEKLLSLEDDYAVYCGHGPNTSIGSERINNPFLNGMYS